MAVASVNNNDRMKFLQHQNMLTEAQLYLSPDKEDEMPENESSEKPSPETSTYNRPCSDFSMMTTSIASKKSPSRSFKYAKLERALIAANMLKTNKDRMKFENDYLIAIRDDTLEKFIRDYYKKIQDYEEKIQHDKELKETRKFAFSDFEQNCLALYPTRDIRIEFINGPTPSTVTKTSISRSASARPKSTLLAPCDEEAVELFYAEWSQHLLEDPTMADKKIKAHLDKKVETYAHRAAQCLHERLPRMGGLSRRVQIVDKRISIGKPNERTLLEMNHKRAISLITQRRHLVIKMMAQTKKNQIKIDQQWKRTPIGVDNSTCYREILQRANQIEESHRERPIERPQTAIVTRSISVKNLPLSSSTNVSPARANTAPTIPLLLTPFQDSLSLFEIENSKNVRILSARRPLTAPTKVDWINYC